jgi:hypothetical protein
MQVVVAVGGAVQYAAGGSGPLELALAVVCRQVPQQVGALLLDGGQHSVGKACVQRQ